MQEIRNIQKRRFKIALVLTSLFFCCCATVTCVAILSKVIPTPFVQNSNSTLVGEWTQNIDNPKVLVDQGVVVSFNADCVAEEYNLIGGEKLISVNFSQKIVIEDGNTCKNDSIQNYFVSPDKSGVAFLLFSASATKKDPSQYIIYLDIKNSKFSWIQRVDYTFGNTKVVFGADNIFVFTSLVTDTIQISTGRVINHTTFPSVERTHDQKANDVYDIKKVGDKYYLYIRRSDKYIAVNLTDNKTIYDKAPFEIFGKAAQDTSFPEQTKLLDDRIAIGSGNNFVYLIDLATGGVTTKFTMDQFQSKYSAQPVENVLTYAPFVYKDIVFLFTSEASDGPTFAVNYKTGKLIHTYTGSRLSFLEADKGLVVTNNWGWVALIDKDNFNIIWEKNYKRFSRLLNINSAGNVVFSENNPDSSNCHVDCDSYANYWELDIATGEKMREISYDETGGYRCDYSYENLCLVNSLTQFGDGGFDGFTIYDTNASKKLFEQKNLTRKSYLYRDLIIYIDCKFGENNNNPTKTCDYVLNAARLRN